MAENTTLIHQTTILEGLEDFCNHLIESDKFSSCDELYEAFVSVSLGHCSLQENSNMSTYSSDFNPVELK